MTLKIKCNILISTKTGDKMAIVKVKSINDIKLPDSPKIKGDNGEIYQYTGSLYFKKIPFNKGDLTLKENQERLEILTKVMNLQGTKYLILPQNIYITDDTLLGYTSKIKEAKTIRNISLNSKYDDVIKSFKLLRKDIRILADKDIFNYDTTSDNILYDGRMYLIDFDNSIYCNDRVYLRTLHNIFETIYLSLVKDGFGSPLLMERDLEKLEQEFKSFQSTNYDLYFELLRWKLETYTRKRIKTVGDLRMCLSLTKRG